MHARRQVAVRMDGLNLEVYLGTSESLLEIAHRRAAGWHRCYSIIDVLKASNRKTVFITTVTHIYKTWQPTKANKNILEVTVVVMHQMMTGVLLCEHIDNKTLRQRMTCRASLLPRAKVKFAGLSMLLALLTSAGIAFHRAVSARKKATTR